MSKLPVWRCPKCKQEIQALATEVTHRCPSNKNLLVQWESAGKNE